MRCLLVHNYYQHAGGEDQVFRAEQDLLRSKGHEVIMYVRSNDEIRDYGMWRKLGVGVRTTWASDTARQLRSLLKGTKPDIAHFHNTFPLVSPAAYYACADFGVPVIQTLHNYRLICAAGICFRDDHVCEDCVHHGLSRGIVHACYRESRPATAGVTAMLAFHRIRHTWKEKVDRFIALSEFSKKKFVQSGLRESQIAVRPNFLTKDPTSQTKRGEYALFVGRLSPEKGLATLLDAWKKLPRTSPLRIVGDGPMRVALESEVAANGMSHVRFEGQLSHEETVRAMQGARLLVFPSRWYECFPMTLLEAFACGVPIVASRMGAMAEIIENGRTGLHFDPGDAEALAKCVEWAWDHPDEMQQIGHAGRKEYETKYTPERNYETLMNIYGAAISSRKQSL